MSRGERPTCVLSFHQNKVLKVHVVPISIKVGLAHMALASVLLNYSH